MSYSKLGIINLALTRIGVRRIASLTDGTEQQEDAIAVWDYILDEVLEAAEWVFAKTWIALERADPAPASYYDYAYLLPVDFLKFCRKRQDDADMPVTESAYPYKIETLQFPDGAEKAANGAFTGAATSWTLGAQWTYASNRVSKAAGGVTTLSQASASMTSAPVVDEIYLLEFEIVAIDGGSIIPAIGGVSGSPVSTTGTKQQYIRAESASSGIVFTPSAAAMTCTIDNVSVLKITDKRCLLTNYDDTDDPLYINFIKRVVDATLYSAAFVNALAFRLAAELAINRTEGSSKHEAMMSLYGGALLQAQALNASMDSVEDEAGNDDWETAGR